MNRTRRIKEYPILHFASCVLLVFLLASSGPLYAGYSPLWPFAEEEREITGTVTDTEGNPLIGASVVVKGTSIGTITDVDGNFSLDVPDDADVLVFSYVGYLPQEVNIGNRTVVDVSLSESATALEEVVVVGYGTQKKSDLTGAVASLSSEELNSQPISSLEQGLQGRIAGVQIVSNSSAPGGGISVRIRGNTSILNGSEPLYVIDGFPVTGQSQFRTSAGRGLDSSTGTDYTVNQNPLAALNPADIESVEVLKDASAAAIYGVRGANGVVLITTKRGKQGAPRVSYNTYVGVQEAAQTYDVLNAQEFQDYANLAETNGGNPPVFTSPPTADNNWQEMVLRQAPIQNHQLSVSGGSDRVKYLLSGGYFNQQGIIKNSAFERFSSRLNLDINASDRLKFGTSINISRSINNAALTEGEARNGVIAAAVLLAPNLPVFQPDGDYSRGDDLAVPNAGGSQNPIALIDEASDENVITRMLGTLFGEYSFTPDLTLRVSVGADLENRDRHVFRSSLFDENGINAADVSNLGRTSLLNENTLNYTKQLGNDQLSVLAGFTVQSEREELRLISASGFVTDITGPYALGTGSNVPTVESGIAEFNIASFLGRINYNIDNKYLFTVTGRRDGSSKFAEGNKWAFFPSVAGAWRLSNEEFLKGSQLIYNLKLRAGYGVVGNQELPPYRSLALLQASNYNFGMGSIVSGFSPLRVAVPDLTWETTSQLNLGLDLSLFKGRFNFTADYYVKSTEDLLLEVGLPETSGITDPSVQNLGEMENRGVELNFDGVVVDAPDFRWRAGFNISWNENEVTSLGDENIYGDLSFLAAQPTFAGSTVRSFVIVGQPIGVFYGWRTDGLYRTPEEAEAGQDIQPGVQAGMIRYIDTDSDGDIDEADRTVLASPFPDFIYGFNSNFEYKNFEFRFFFQGQSGGSVYNFMRRFATPGTGANGVLRERLDFWTPDNIDAKYPEPNSNPPVVGGGGNAGDSDFYLEDATYLRLRETTLTYRFPKTFLGGKVGGSVYVTGQNLFTITDYSGYNPDVNSRSGARATFGFDVGSYPLARTFLLGLNLNF